MGEEHSEIVEQPVHKIAAPLFLITSIPFFGALVYDYLNCCETDNTFAWFGLFYLIAGGYYLLRKVIEKS